ncbi:MAG TPA: hypothetical protein VFA85_14625 [Terriglobales bacterium]|nr:hypothetical protein [Terriglobales bacterium]
MKRCALLFLILVFALHVLAQSGSEASPLAFKKIQALAGDWEGKDASGMPAKTNFKVVVADTTVMETLQMHGEPEMLTLYTVDGDGIALVHFCPTNNQPRMRAVPKNGEISELDFQFTGGGNLPDSSVGHQHRLVLRFEDENHVTEEWTWRSKGKDSEMVIHFSRKGK